MIPRNREDFQKFVAGYAGWRLFGKMRPMEYSKKIAIRELNRLGFDVEEIPETDSKRADLRASDGQHVYHIEAKDKFESDIVPVASQDDFYRSTVSRKNATDVIKALKDEAGIDFRPNPIIRHSF